jgi:hypothetical protein
VLGVSMMPAAALAGSWGGGGASASGSDGDWALRDELKNPRLIQPGSHYGYDRSARSRALALPASLSGGLVLPAGLDDAHDAAAD